MDMSNQKVLWRPSEEFKRHANLHQFEVWLKDQKGLTFSSYDELWQWSTDKLETFWESIWQYFDIIHHAPYQKVLSGMEMPGVRWFEGASLNYAEHVFRNKSEDRPALIFQSEREEHMHIPWAALEESVVAIRNYLKEKGIGKGDCVAGYLPNIPEAIMVFLAVNSLGAVWTCCSPDFGVNTVIERFSQTSPKLLFAVDGYQYNGKPFERQAEVSTIQSKLDSLEETVLLSYLDRSKANLFSQAISWGTIMEDYASSEALTFTAVPFDHPIWVLYSSGTTGKPKAITHSHGGILLEHLKYMAFHNDVHEGENFFWFTTTGWMMWNFLIGSLLVGATPVLFDGSPGNPDLNVLWQMAEKLPIHHFGTSAPYLVACMKKGITPKRFDLSKLRSVSSTGAPLPPEAFDWVYDKVGSHIWLCSMSGGTDVCTAFVGGCPSEPVYRGAIQCRALGCALQGYDENGNSVVGSLGEMVIEKPMPSMPIYFWNDEGDQRYRASYFEEYPNKWRHGDWIKVFENGSLIIQGRSDATLNRKGVRIGTAEIYNVLDGMEALKDSMVLNLEKSGGEDVMPLFVVLHENYVLDESLKSLIKRTLKVKCSPRHVPDMILEVPDIPYTLSGKKMEVPVKKILLGMDSSKSLNKDATRNPEAVEFFLNFGPDFRKAYLGG